LRILKLDHEKYNFFNSEIILEDLEETMQNEYFTNLGESFKELSFFMKLNQR